MGNEIVYCSKCQTRLLNADFERGTAFKIEGIASCDKCSADVLKLLPPEKIQDFLHQMAKAKKKAEPSIPETENRRAMAALPVVPAVPKTRQGPTSSEGLRAAAWIGMGLGAAGLIAVIFLATRSSDRPEPEVSQPSKTAPSPTSRPVAPVATKPKPTEPGTATLARIVRIQNPNPILNMAEVQVFSGGVNVALKGTASQSSTYTIFDAKLAIDGNTDGDAAHKSVSHTADKEPTSWWEVDLGKMVPIERVVVWNRTDTRYQVRMKGYSVMLLDEARKPVESQKSGGYPDPSAEHVFGSTGRR